MKRILKHSEFLETRLIKEEFIKTGIEKFFGNITGTYRNITGVTKDRMNWILNNVDPLGQLEDRISKISENERDEYLKKLLDFLQMFKVTRGSWWVKLLVSVALGIPLIIVQKETRDLK